MVDIDISYGYDYPLGRKNYRLIDSLTTVLAQKIYKDSMDWTNQICENCNEETLQRFRENSMVGKRTLKICLDFYTSEKLDSIARANIKPFKW